MKKCGLFGLLAGLLLACYTPRPKAGTEPYPLISRLDSVFRQEHLMGMSVALVCDDQLAYSKGFGWADEARRIPMTPRTIARVASISKSVTATALMMLYEQGKCSLDKDVSEYLGFSLRNPHFPQTPITLRMLMSHTSSIQDGEAYERFQAEMQSRQLPLSDLFQQGGAYYSPEMFLQREPGQYFHYANASWGLVASVIERLSGQRFDEYTQQHIFQPLGMDAAFNLWQLSRIDSLAVLYRFVDDKWEPQADNFGGKLPPQPDMSWYLPGHNGLLFGPQGSLRSSTLDLVKFMRLHINKGTLEGTRLLKESTVALMHAPQWEYSGDNGDTFGNFMFSWGLGFHRLVRRDSADILFPDRDMIGHPGEAYGLISDMYFDTESRSGVVFITNGSRYPYKYGLETTFYRPEERVFQAIFDSGLCE